MIFADCNEVESIISIGTIVIGMVIPSININCFLDFCDLERTIKYHKGQDITRGIILIDMLLITGNTQDRFLLIDIENKKIDIDSLRITVIPKGNNSYFRDLTSKMLNLFPLVLDNSRLNIAQKHLIRNGYGI